MCKQWGNQLFGYFQAEDDLKLFAMVANHTMKSHNGGGVDAFNNAALALPHIGAFYEKDAREHAERYILESS